MAAPRSQRSTSNLPRELTSFVGRARELADVEALLEREPRRVVTLVGPPGTGKTRTALRLSRELRDRGGLPGGAWFVDLDAARGAVELFERTALVLGLRLPENADASDFIGHVIAARGRALFVFDNVEQLVGAAADALQSFRATAPEALILVTSREPLRIAAEQIYELLPPAEPEALELLLERAPGFSLTDDNAQTVSHVLHVLDKIPLAIELLAARVGVLGIEEVARRIHRLDALGRGPRDSAGRQATLRGTLDWSWDLLDADERRALSASSVFRDGFSASAFVAVAGFEEGRALDLLQALREKSLLRSRVLEKTRETRFFHYGSIATYAGERLEELGIAAAARAAHAGYFAATAREFATKLKGQRAAEALFFLGLEHENVALALGYAERDPEHLHALLMPLCLALEPIVQRRGLLAWYVNALDRALAIEDAAGAGQSELAIEARLVRARTLRALGKLGEAKRDIDDVLSRRDAPLPLAIAIRAEAAQIELGRGQFTASQEHSLHALHDLKKVDDPELHARVLGGHGLFHHSQGRLDEALSAYEAALAQAKAAEAPVLAFALYKDIGTLRLQQGRFAEARAAYDHALSIDPDLADPAVVAMIRGNLGILEQELGNFATAREHFAAALDEFSQSGARLYEAHLLGYSGALHHEQHELEAAVDAYEEAIMLLRAVGDRRLEGLFSAAAGAAEARRERLQRAEEHFSHAQTLLNEVEDPGLLAALALHRGQLLLAESGIAARRGESALSHQLRERALSLVAEWRAQSAASDDARFALRLLERELASMTLSYDPELRSVQPPGGAAIDLSARVPLFRIVQALIEKRLEAPGEALDVNALLAAGWPGERVRADAGANRVKVALSTLRKLGLRDVIVHRGDGHAIDPAVPVAVVAKREH